MVVVFFFFLCPIKCISVTNGPEYYGMSNVETCCVLPWPVSALVKASAEPSSGNIGLLIKESSPEWAEQWEDTRLSMRILVRCFFFLFFVLLLHWSVAAILQPGTDIQHKNTNWSCAAVCQGFHSCMERIHHQSLDWAFLETISLWCYRH